VLGLRERETQSYHAGGSHRTPQRKGEGMIARSRAIPRWRSEPRYEEKRLAPLEKRIHDLSAMQFCRDRHGALSNDFAPITRCDMSTATAA